MTEINSLQKLMDTMTSFVRETFNPRGQVMAMWTVMCEDGTVMPIVSPFNGDADKDMTAFIVKKLIKDHNGYMLGFMSETWLITTRDDPTVNKYTVPSEHPKRREGVFFIVEDKFGKSISGHMEITRADDGAGILGEYQPSEYAHNTEGRFTNMFGVTETVN